MEFRSIMMALVSIFRSFSFDYQGVDRKFPGAVVSVTARHYCFWALLIKFAAHSTETTGGPFTRTRNFSKISNTSRQKNRLLFFAASAFHTNRNWCSMSLGGIEFAVFAEASEADVEARVNGEYLWGRHFAYHHGKRSFRLPVLFCS
jgi:hypothetical protein